ncbi:MAG: winged helix-turn-helix domain-containing protein [Methanophagales archaeon]|nr:winged helix-turn-helix domain-containing protein [Methanophagales archaeon]
MAAFVYERFGKRISIRTAIRYLHRLGFELKRARKKFKKADPEKQKRFAKDLQELEKNRSPRSVTVYVDEGQIWCDASLGRIWSPIGAEVESTSPSKKILFYTAVVRPMGKVITMMTDWFNREKTADFLDKLRIFYQPRFSYQAILIQYQA